MRGEWYADFCQPICILKRFPTPIWALWEMLGYCMIPVGAGMAGVMWRLGVEEFEATRKRAGIKDEDVDDLWELLYFLFTKWESCGNDKYIDPRDVEKIKELTGPTDGE